MISPEFVFRLLFDIGCILFWVGVAILVDAHWDDKMRKRDERIKHMTDKPILR